MSNIRWKIAQWAERIWWKRYLKNKSVEEYLHWKENYWNGFLDKIGIDKKQIENNNIIDLGCGPAGIFMLFKNATAVDPLLDKYDKDLAHFSKENYSTNTFTTSSIEDYQPQEKFETLFCINAINHVSDMQKGIAKLIECASDSAQLIISIDAHNHNFLKKIFQLLPGDILHPHQYKLQEYKDKIEAAGWEITQTVEMDRAFIFNYYVLVANKI